MRGPNAILFESFPLREKFLTYGFRSRETTFSRASRPAPPRRGRDTGGRKHTAGGAHERTPSAAFFVRRSATRGSRERRGTDRFHVETVSRKFVAFVPLPVPVRLPHPRVHRSRSLPRPSSSRNGSSAIGGERDERALEIRFQRSFLIRAAGSRRRTVSRTRAEGTPNDGTAKTMGMWRGTRESRRSRGESGETDGVG